MWCPFKHVIGLSTLTWRTVSLLSISVEFRYVWRMIKQYFVLMYIALSKRPVRPDGYPTTTIRDLTAIRKCTRTPTNTNTMWEKVPKNTNYKTSALLLPPVPSYYVLTARAPRPLHAYGVSFEIYGLSNGVHQKFRGALTTLMGSLLRHFYVYYDWTATLRRFYHVFTVTIKTGQIFGNLILKTDDVKETSFPKPWPCPRHINISNNLHLAISNLIIR